MDEVLGAENFVSFISFKTTSGAGSPSGGTDVLASVNDFLIWYGRDASAIKYRQLYKPKSQLGGGADAYNKLELPDGTRRNITAVERVNPPAGRLFRFDNLTSQSSGGPQFFDVELEGAVFPVGKSGWKTTRSGMDRLIAARRVGTSGRTLSYIRFLDDFPVFPYNNAWDDTVTAGFAADKVYVVQTNSKVIERCMLMCTDPGDLVLDPTCGSGTTAYVAEQWGRRWITIDTSRVALALARQRVMGARFPYYLLADSPEGRKKESELSAQSLPPAEATGDIRHGFVYERVQHITLKSIANNPDITEGMSRAEIDAAIRRHAEYELLYDKPYEDSKKVRVAGPFTVESLSPHRSLAFAGSAVDGTGAVNTDTAALSPDEASSGSSFEQTILANLRAAGIQNGRRDERLSFDSVESYAGVHVQAVGVREGASEGTPRRVGITVGPQYGTVDGRFIKEAAREAIHTDDLDLLCVLAFAFDPGVLGSDAEYVTSVDGFANVAAERRMGRVPVLLVRMNADLVMGEELKKTGAGNLFTVFGEPDIDIKSEGDELRVVLRGVDVYDPNTGQVRSDDTDQVALWMIDTAYNDESFFVRHCYFTGGQDPYARLKRALKADIDPEAWESLYRTESRPFTRPETGKIAVKVINDYGDEVMKVFEV